MDLVKSYRLSRNVRKKPASLELMSWPKNLFRESGQVLLRLGIGLIGLR